jgi:hypothetical protein
MSPPNAFRILYTINNTNVVKQKVNISLLQAVEAPRVAMGPYIFLKRKQSGTSIWRHVIIKCATHVEVILF